MTAPIILASKSAARGALLAAAGVSFDTVASGVDEQTSKARLMKQGENPRDIAAALANMKAEAVSKNHPGLVIGADQTLELDNQLFDKAEDLSEAREHLIQLRGRRHHLHAAVAVAENGQVIWRETLTVAMTMRQFSDAFLDAYLQRHGARILFSVGCYEFEGEGVQLFDKIEGDYFAILGLPMLGLLDLLRERGVLSR